MAFCSNCGKEIAADAKFCSGCGVAVDALLKAKKSKEKRYMTGIYINVLNVVSI